MPAGSTGPDLSFAQEQSEALLDDRCDITRSTVTGTNTSTLALTTSDSTVATDAHCSVRHSREAVVRVGDRVADYEMRVPLDTAEIQRDDLVTITASRRDPQLVGKVFRVVEVVQKTFAVTRLCYLERLV